MLPAFRTVPEERRGRYAAAMRLSLRLDVSNGHPNPASVHLLQSDKYGFSEAEQRQWYLALTRPLAMQFLKEWSSTTKAFEREQTTDRYSEMFRKTPYTLGRYPRTMLLTYAEWLHLRGYRGREPKLPEEIKSYLG